MAKGRPKKDPKKKAVCCITLSPEAHEVLRRKWHEANMEKKTSYSELILTLCAD